ncbi:MAG: hypothetical protein O7H41_18320 [Planctomycetota bacterium]|nr:hypothetical protein [Planctomycetota bacterium]
MELDSQLVLYIFVVLLLFLLLPERGIFLTTVSFSLRYFLCGILWPLSFAMGFSPCAFHDRVQYTLLENWIILCVFLTSPIWFSLGVRSSRKKMGSLGEKVLLWMNLVGFVVSGGFTFVFIFNYLEVMKTLAPPLRVLHSPFIAVVIPATLLLISSAMVLWLPSIRIAWSRFWPRFPALLLVPTILATWVAACVLELYPSNWWDYGSGWGFPMRFYGRWNVPIQVDSLRTGIYHGFRLDAFLFDLELAIIAAWLFPVLLDRLVFPLLRGKRRARQGHGEPN